MGRIKDQMVDSYYDEYYNDFEYSDTFFMRQVMEDAMLEQLNFELQVAAELDRESIEEILV